MVISLAGSPPAESGNSTRRVSENMPVRIGKRPVSKAARLGVQTEFRSVKARPAPAFRRHAIKVRSADGRIAEAAQIAISQIIAKDHDEIGRTFVGLREGERSQKKQCDQYTNQHCRKPS